MLEKGANPWIFDIFHTRMYRAVLGTDVRTTFVETQALCSQCWKKWGRRNESPSRPNTVLSLLVMKAGRRPHGKMGADNDQPLSQLEQGHIDDDKVDTAVYRQSKSTPFIRQVKQFQAHLGFTFFLVLCGLVLTYISLFIRSFVHSFVCFFVHVLLRFVSLFRSLVRLFVRLFACLLVCLFVWLSVCSFVCVLV